MMNQHYCFFPNLAGTLKIQHLTFKIQNSTGKKEDSTLLYVVGD